MTLLRDVEVFAVGEYGPKGRYTEADLDGFVEAARWPQPVPVRMGGHAGPSIGFASRLRREGTLLLCDLEIPQGFVAKLEQEGCRRASVEIRFVKETCTPAITHVALVARGTVRILADIPLQGLSRAED